MARVSRVETCLLCDEAPCRCNAPATKQARKVASLKPRPRSGSADAIRATVARQSKPPQPRILSAAAASPVVPQFKPTEDEHQAVFASAIRALAPLMCREDRERFSAIINSRETPAQRAAAWRGRKSANDQQV